MGNTLRREGVRETRSGELGIFESKKNADRVSRLAETYPVQEMAKLLVLSIMGSLVSARNKTMLTRSLASIGNQLAQYNGYGCWCYFDETNYARGKGAPVDVVDKLCKKYSEGFQCIMMSDDA